MQSLTIWQLFHTYQRLADEGKAAPLVCPDDGTEMVTMVKNGDYDTLYLWCPYHDLWIKPGLDVIDQVKAVVKEHYDV